jgi:hypothetical protein
MMILQCYVTCASGKTLLNEFRSRIFILKTNGSTRIPGVMNHKPPEGMRIYKSIAGATHMYLMNWKANYMLV